MLLRFLFTAIPIITLTCSLAAQEQPLSYGPTPTPSNTLSAPAPQSFLPPSPLVTTNAPPANWQPGPVRPPEVAPPVSEPTTFEHLYQDDLFHYTWIDFGDAPGLRVHRIEMTNAWADMRSLQFFSRPFNIDSSHLNSGISFAVQWWKDQAESQSPPMGSALPPVLYDLYVDIGWRVALTPVWLIDLAISPGLATDFRVTPPDGFRLKGHAITMFDMLPNLRAVAGVSYQNRESLKLIPVGGFSIGVTDRTRIEAIFPQPRIIHQLGDWRGTAWDISIGGEFGGSAWAFKNDENTRETIDYRDLRALVGFGWNSSRGQGTLQAGYVFQRELRYGSQQAFNFDPGNAWMIRLGWDY